MTKCPRCFNALPDHVAAFTEAQPRSTSIDERASAYRGHPSFMGQVMEYQNSGGALELAEKDLGTAVLELCPICHYRLPPHWRTGHATCLTMAGARTTGKTVFIAVMIKQLQRHLERGAREVDFANAETARIYREVYERILFEERGILPPTPSAGQEESHQHDPLIFNLGLWNGVRESLVIRDVAGEDLESGQVGGRAWEFFSLADAVVFLFDPMRVEEVNHQLRDLVPADSTGGDPRQVLKTVMRLIGDGDPKLAVVLSKFDALQQLRKVTRSWWGQVMSNAGAAFSRDPGLTDRPYDDDDGWLLHAEVHSLLQRLDAGPILGHLTNPYTGRQYNHRFFAVSALGDCPRGSKVNGISPFRCMDPVRWVLAERQVLT
jgi:hypothetical protein